MADLWALVPAVRGQRHWLQIPAHPAQHLAEMSKVPRGSARESRQYSAKQRERLAAEGQYL